MKAGWFIWLGFTLSFFIGYEWWALSRNDGLSLSQLTVDAFYAWPPFGFLLGLAIGMLIAHLFWPWVPRQLRATCGECGETVLLDKRKLG